MAFHGADVEQLERLAGELKKAATTTFAARAQLTSAISKLAGWTGPDAARFRSAWNSTYSPGLQSLTDGLNDASTSVKRNADEQRTTSTKSNSASMAAIFASQLAMDHLAAIFKTGEPARASLLAAIISNIASQFDLNRTRKLLLFSIMGASGTVWERLLKDGHLDFLRASDLAEAQFHEAGGTHFGSALDEADPFLKSEFPTWVGRTGKVLKGAGIAGDIIGGGLAARDQWANDAVAHPDWSNGARLMNAAGKGVAVSSASGLGALGGAQLGIALGTLGGPPGMIVGGIIGGVAGGILGGGAGGAIYDGASWVGQNASQVFDGAYDGAAAVGGAVSHGVSNAGHAVAGAGSKLVGGVRSLGGLFG